MTQNREQIIEKFWQLTDRGKKSNISDQQKVSELQNWGVQYKATEKSSTLKTLVEDKGICHQAKLPEDRKYKHVFENICKELDLAYSIAEVAMNDKFKRENPLRSGVAIKVDTNPNWTFLGFGNNKAEATEAASRKGVRFFITVSSDNVVF